MSSVHKELKQKLYYHEKLISMIGDSALPIKKVLLNDIREMKQVIETASEKEKKEGKKNGTKI